MCNTKDLKINLKKSFVNNCWTIVLQGRENRMRLKISSMFEMPLQPEANIKTSQLAENKYCMHCKNQIWLLAPAEQGWRCKNELGCSQDSFENFNKLCVMKW